jgi:uncharacterized protein involved in exopolysaccharide biosynthesis
MEDKNKTREIDLIGILKKMFSNKKALAIFIIVFVIAGVVVALNTPKQYTANVVLAPEISGMGMSKSIGDLASMVGVNSEYTTLVQWMLFIRIFIPTFLHLMILSSNCLM